MAKPTANPTQARTVLFVDIVGSTQLYDSLGNEAARARLGPCLQAFLEVVRRHGGQTVKSLGDGLLAVFTREATAMVAALDLLDCALRHRMRARVGLHSGDVVEQQGDLFGQTVNLAARICCLAGPSEVLVSTAVFERLPRALQRQARPVRHPSIKGVQDALDLFGILRDDPDNPLTSTLALQLGPPRTGELEFAFAGRTWRVGQVGAFTLGRDKASDLVVDNTRVSRHHATVSVRRAKFVLRDESVNGTWLVPDGGSGLNLLREESILSGSGRIYLGHPPDRPGAVWVAFRVHAAPWEDGRDRRAGIRAQP